MAIQNPEVTIFNPLRRLAPFVALATATAVITACNRADANESTLKPESTISDAPSTEIPTTTPAEASPRTTETGLDITTPTLTAKPENPPDTPESTIVSVETMEAMDYREFEEVDQDSKVAWRFSVIDNQKFIEEGIRWDRQKSNNGQFPDYYKLANGQYNGMLLDNNYLVVKPSLNNKPQQILDLDNFGLRYALWSIKDEQQMLDHNKLNKFINTQFFDARPGTGTYELYTKVIASTSNYAKPTNITNVLHTGATAGKVVPLKLSKNNKTVSTMTIPVDLWQKGIKNSSENITYVLTTIGENSMWQRLSMEPLE